jgi:formylglycine-generating enzyme required for sulfatase activity
MNISFLFILSCGYNPSNQNPDIRRGMREIPAGTFLMGSNEAGNDPLAQPVHTVSVSAFSMDSSEVTQADYLAIMGVNPSHFTGDLRRPVEMLTWFDAVLYCNARSRSDGLDTIYSYTSIYGTPGNGCDSLGGLSINYSKKGYRLPTEAEWEWACRAGTTTEYYWGDTLDSAYCWYNLNSLTSTHPVCLKTPNAWGLYDMSGNVWEWCNDWRGTYDSLLQVDPIGPPAGTYRVFRGGSWNYYLDNLRSAGRNDDDPGYHGCFDGGFRCVFPR